MKDVLRGVLLLFLFGIGYELYSTHQNLRHTIHQQNQQITEILLKQSISDSACANLFSYLPLGSPLEFIIINSKFGFRKDPFSRRYKKHMGIDLKGTKKDTVYATGSGYVECGGYYGGYGKCVIINHGNGYKTLYGHLNKVLIKEKTFIVDKQPIGMVGNTGHSKGTHLHYEIHKNGIPIDPKNLIFI